MYLHKLGKNYDSALKVCSSLDLVRTSLSITLPNTSSEFGPEYRPKLPICRKQKEAVSRTATNFSGATRAICAMVKSRYIGDGHPTFNIL